MNEKPSTGSRRSRWPLWVALALLVYVLSWGPAAVVFALAMKSGREHNDPAGVFGSLLAVDLAGKTLEARGECMYTRYKVWCGRVMGVVK